MLFDVFVEKAFFMVILFSGLPLVLISILSLLVSGLQAITQVQEQSIGFLVKFASLSILIMLLGGYFSQSMVIFFQDILQSIAVIGRA